MNNIQLGVIGLVLMLAGISLQLGPEGIELTIALMVICAVGGFLYEYYS